MQKICSVFFFFKDLFETLEWLIFKKLWSKSYSFPLFFNCPHRNQKKAKNWTHPFAYYLDTVANITNYLPNILFLSFWSPICFRAAMCPTENKMHFRASFVNRKFRVGFYIQKVKLMAGVTAFRTIHLHVFNTGLVNEI